MQRTKKSLTYLIAGLMLVSVSGCGLSSHKMSSLSPNQTAVAQPLDNSTAPAESQPAAIEQNTIEVSLFYPDSNCETLVPELAAVPKDLSLEAAVARVIEKAENGDFDLAGYRVSVDNGLATVDLRLAPNSRRHFLSMTACEQFALFGSLRKTLTDNPQWKVQDVRFTENGEDLMF
jgi:Sporulation and spore germination